MSAILFLSFTRCMKDCSTLLLSVLSCLLLRCSLLAVKRDKYRWSLDVLQGSKCSLPTILCSCCPFSPLFSCCLRHYTFYRFFHYHSSFIMDRFYELLLGLFSTIASNLKEIVVHHTDPP